MSSRKHHASVDRTKIELRQNQALQRRIAGETLRQIAESQNVDIATVHRDIQAALEAHLPALEDIDAQRAIQYQRYDELIAAWMPNALDGDQSAAAQVTVWLDRQTKLLGLERPAQVVVAASIRVEMETALAELDQIIDGMTPTDAAPRVIEGTIESTHDDTTG